jgi:hypothetical protein
MRLWRDEPPTQDKPSRRHEYEVVGYVITGRAELEIEGPSIPTAFWRRSRQSKRPLLLLRYMGARSLSVAAPTATVSRTRFLSSF